MNYNYNEFKNRKSYKIWTDIFRVISKPFYKIELVGEKNISSSSYIVSCNHLSHIDFLMLPLSKKLPQLHYMAMSELFRKPIQARFMKSMNCFPVHRGNGKSKIAIEHSINLLKNGFCLGIFPEGALNKNAPYNPLDAKSGIAIIALESKSDVLPCTIYCKEKIKPFCSKITITYSKPIKFEEINNFYNGCNDYKKTAEFIFDRTKNVWENCNK